MVIFEESLEGFDSAHAVLARQDYKVELCTEEQLEGYQKGKRKY